MKYVKITILLMLIFLSCNCVIAQSSIAIPDLDHIDRIYYFLEGSDEVISLEKHVGGSRVEFPKNKEFSYANGNVVLRGNTSGIVIKSSDPYVFILRSSYTKVKPPKLITDGLFKLQKKDGNRILPLLKNEKQKIDCKEEPFPNGVTRIIPETKLSAGEYAFSVAGSYFTFRIQ